MGKGKRIRQLRKTTTGTGTTTVAAAAPFVVDTVTASPLNHDGLVVLAPSLTETVPAP